MLRSLTVSAVNVVQRRCFVQPLVEQSVQRSKTEECSLSCERAMFGYWETFLVHFGSPQMCRMDTP